MITIFDAIVFALVLLLAVVGTVYLGIHVADLLIDHRWHW